MVVVTLGGFEPKPLPSRKLGILPLDDRASILFLEPIERR